MEEENIFVVLKPAVIMLDWYLIYVSTLICFVL